MNRYRALQAAWWIGLGLLAAAACGKGGVVGGDCLPGFIVCQGSCVNPHVHARNCGECGNVCPDGEICNDGECGRGGSGSAGESGAAGAAGEDGVGGTQGIGGAAGGEGGIGGIAGSGTGGFGTGGFGTGGFGTGGLGTGGGTGGDGVGGGSGGDGVGGGSGGDGVGGTPGNTTSTTSVGGAGMGGAGMGGTGGTQSGNGGVGGSLCYPPYDSPEACGDCETQCEGGTPLCAPAAGGGYECVRRCDTGLTVCEGRCVDLDTNPRHCGRCGNVCASGVCIDGLCQGTTAGHVVYICMNYAAVFEESAQTRLIGNVVFLPARNTVRVLAYSDHARNSVMNATDRAIHWAADREGRGVEITRIANLNRIETDLVIADYDVFLVYDQSEADTGDLAAAGTQLAGTLSTFTSGGGVVVVLSGAVGIAEMNQFATAAGLAQIGTETPYESLAYVRTSADVISVNVVSPFQTLDDSCTFATTETPSAQTVFVVTDTPPGSGVGTPIVLHKVVEP